MQALRHVLLVGVVLVPATVWAQDRATIAIAVGDPGDDSYRIGQELGARLVGDDATGGARFELWESLNPPERILVLIDEVQLAVVPDGEAVPEHARAAVGAVLDAGGYQVLVRADLDPALVDKVRRVVLDQDAKETVAVTATALAAEPPASKSFVVYFDFDRAEFDPQQISTVAAACRYAATLPSASFMLAGHADTAGPEAYNERLSRSRAQSVAATIRNDERFRDALNVIEFGEHKLAVPTLDEVREPMNRRVVITVMPAEMPIRAAGPASGG